MYVLNYLGCAVAPPVLYMTTLSYTVLKSKQLLLIATLIWLLTVISGVRQGSKVLCCS